jgi:hypothetical protein
LLVLGRAIPRITRRRLFMKRLAPRIGAAVVLIAALLPGGCERRKYYISDCETSHPGPECPKKETCPGQCVTIPPLGGWELGVLLWVGPALEAPACPADRAPVVGYEGFADPEAGAPPECSACSCDPPSGECELPSVLTASTDTGCPDDDALATHTDFSGLDRPGLCNNDNPIAAVQGLVVVEPLTLIETGCRPSAPPPPNEGTLPWKTFARACRGNSSPCLDPSKVCVPAPPVPPPGFSQCIFREGDHECPGEYPTKHVFYDEASDSRGCSACSCAAPEGGVCSATVTVFPDALCEEVAVGGGNVTSLVPGCIPLVPGAVLGGKMATEPTYEPGTCEPLGGAPIGSVELKGPSTFCCQ